LHAIWEDSHSREKKSTKNQDLLLPMKRSVDIVVLSDIHLGSYACHAKELLHYLESIEVGTLILNGDFIDMAHVNDRHFPKAHLEIIRCVVDMATAGTKVYYITGNHDESVRSYSDLSNGNIHFRDKLNLQLKGKSYLILHGDLFDVLLKYPLIVSRLGSKFYNGLVRANRVINKWRQRFSMKPWSLTKEIKTSLHQAQKYITSFEKAAFQLAQEDNHDVIICGHSHVPKMQVKSIDGRDIMYLNAGDWVENLTALEYQWGHWSIFQYDAIDFDVINPKLVVKDQQEEEQLVTPQIILQQLLQQAR
jgi:UDP-2,3-diacylglucosamine pyrophosphatase LpxH